MFCLLTTLCIYLLTAMAMLSLRNFKTEFDMKQLIEDYERRLKTAETMLKEKDYSNIAQAERIKTKASCYRTFIAELKQQCNIAVVSHS